MGHNERNCKKKEAYMGRESQFGAWLKVSNPRSPAKRQASSSQNDEDSSETEKHTQQEKEVRSRLMIAWKENVGDRNENGDGNGERNKDRSEKGG